MTNAHQIIDSITVGQTVIITGEQAKEARVYAADHNFYKGQTFEIKSVEGGVSVRRFQ